MKKFARYGDIVNVTTISEDMKDYLEVNYYNLKFSKMGGFYLKVTESPKLPYIYGNSHKVYGDRIFKTFQKKDENVGVLISGIKGTGKTLLSKYLAKTAVEIKGLPVIYVNEKELIEGNISEFIEFMDSLGDIVVIFDEFFKTFGESVGQLLGYFDDKTRNKHLNIIIDNDIRGRDSFFFIDRPGRIRYHIKYDNLKEDEIVEYLNKNLKDKSKFDKIKKYLKELPTSSFDIMQAIVTEVNEYENIDFIEVVSIMNIPQRDLYKYEMIEMTIDGNKISHDDLVIDFQTNMYGNIDYIDITKIDQNENDQMDIFINGNKIDAFTATNEGIIYKFHETIGGNLIEGKFIKKFNY